MNRRSNSESKKKSSRNRKRGRQVGLFDEPRKNRPANDGSRALRRGTIAAIVSSVVAAALIAAGSMTFRFLRDRYTDGPPLTVVVNDFDDPCNSDWVVPRAPSEIDFTVPFSADGTAVWEDWPGASGGAKAAPSWVLLTVQGKDDREVVINDIRIHVEARRPPIRGTMLDAPCGDTGAYRWLETDLDKEPPRISSQFHPESAGEDVPPRKLTPVQFPYEVSASDAENFAIEAKTSECDCTWWAEVKWTSSGESGSIHTTDLVPLFRVSSSRDTATCIVGKTGCY